MKLSAGQLWEELCTPSDAKTRHTLLFLVIVLLGFFLRLWHVGALTEGMLYDEAYKGLDAISIREYGQRPVFLDWNGGREALVAYSVAATQSFLDHTILSVRIISALYGSLTVIVFYFFVSQLFRRDVALISTFLLAVSKYHIIHSRLGVRAGHFTFFEVAALCFLAAGLFAASRQNLWLAIAGVFAGLGFHTYIAYRIFPAITAAFLLSKDRLIRLKAQWKGALAGLVLACVILAPLLSFYIQNYESMTDRMKRTAVWNEKGKKGEGSPARLVLSATLDTLGMFNFRGDKIERHNVVSEPMLSPFTGPFFLLGVAFALLCIRSRYAVFLLLYLFFTLLPGFLSVDAPNTARVLGCIPPVMLLSGICLTAIAGIVAARLSPKLATVILAVILSGNAYDGINDALLRYPERMDNLSPQVSNLWGLDREPARAAELLNGLGDRCMGFATPQFFFHSAVEYLTYSKSEHELYFPAVNLAARAKGKIAVIVVQQNPGMNLWYLRDDPGKRMYHWWNERYGMKTPWIRAAIKSAYGPHPRLMKSSDQNLLKLLRKKYPHGRFVDFQTFGLYMTLP